MSKFTTTEFRQDYLPAKLKKYGKWSRKKNSLQQNLESEFLRKRRSDGSLQEHLRRIRQLLPPLDL